MIQRLVDLRKNLSSEGLDAILVTSDANQRYLEGYTGSECYLLVTLDATYLIADSRYTELAANDCRFAKVVQHRDPCPPYNEVIRGICASSGVKRLGFEKNSASFTQYDDISRSFANTDMELVPTSDICERLRIYKDDEEKRYTIKACEIADKALYELLPKMKQGVSELDMVYELEYLMGKGGSECVSFQTMVLFGAGSSRPHAVPSHNVKLRAGDLILIDYGAVYNGYRSDTSRTFVSCEADSRQNEQYERVLKSQLAAIAAIKHGVLAKTVDEISRSMLSGEGCFTYGLGHGVGLEIHELPFIRRTSDYMLERDMVITVEPGVYVPGWGGIRVEDTVIVDDECAQVLTKFPKDRLIAV